MLFHERATKEDIAKSDWTSCCKGPILKKDLENNLFVCASCNKHHYISPTQRFDIMFGKGISREGSLLDVGVEHGIVRKGGAWFTYDDVQLGQGKENSKNYLRENPDLALQLENDVYKAVGMIETDENEQEVKDDAVDETDIKASNKEK